MKNLKFLGQWFLVLMTDGQEVNDLCKENVFFLVFPLTRCLVMYNIYTSTNLSLQKFRQSMIRGFSSCYNCMPVIHPIY